MLSTDLFYDQVMPQLPKKWISHFVGAAAHTKVPGLINQKIIKSFAKYYKINVNEAEKPLSEYKSLGDFFSRAHKEGARPVQDELVHPCDGVLIQSGAVHDDLLIQAKGKSFNLNEFVLVNPWEE
ncbi:MAG: phosphatidylserine decarboxylase, partial [Bdellovibrionales bacterium]|nr:phosphatidylserine decarboxylase [Bdellovibrionales bacterium]